MKTNYFAIFSLILASSAAIAQDGQSCLTPIQLQPGATYNSDTTTSANSIGAFGGLPSPGNDLVYSFVGGNLFGAITITNATYDFGVFLVPSCSGGATGSPIQAATGPGTSGSFPVDGLTVGATYFVVVSGDPSVNSPLNGTLVLNTNIPVELQSFEVN